MASKAAGNTVYNIVEVSVERNDIYAKAYKQICTNPGKFRFFRLVLRLDYVPMNGLNTIPTRIIYEKKIIIAFIITGKKL